MLLVLLILEFESHRRDCSIFFQKKKRKRDQLLRAPTVGRRQFDASRRGKKGLKSSRDKKKKTRTVAGRGEKSLLYDLGPELRLGGRKKKNSLNNRS